MTARYTGGLHVGSDLPLARKAGAFRGEGKDYRFTDKVDSRLGRDLSQFKILCQLVFVTCPTRGEKSAYSKCWIVKCVPVTETSSRRNGISLSNRLVTPEEGRSRGTFMDARVLQYAIF